MRLSKIFTLLFFANSFLFSHAQQKTTMIDAFPTNVGGKEEFKRVFEQELIFPKQLLKFTNAYKVAINFTIRQDSTTSDIKIVSSGEPAIDAEALRIFKLYQWIPAVKSGSCITTGWTATFDFDPKKYSKICKERGYQEIKYLSNETIDTSGIIYSNPDQLPAYQKGVYALQDFIKENLEYPRQATLANIQGVVVLKFVVEPSGLVTNIGIEHRVGGGCDEEAIRVLQLIKWYPAKKNEKLVRAEMSFPFNFALNNDFKDNSNSEQK